ncbi:MAG: hypothetical protein COU35_03965 [Candidatus Magasanikbacteria bacterium CG10_big_fil_rev_8_21_14_0_10_47_10]|uniref:Glycosyl transferase family 1 domain-containing protein n=1 Tax=Candidatus Magasanikbacteria bacterium CG10_big_fil_rev_8_21_14_0_10_47_10 TaxID=1974652 RepID=A0A2H0TRZ8_9BACT|nr:MAG: hypothetical protein COU35_03965 [Candidatus Magasanikbacteria bacterium CG10_big_fil_rev_8_21_14_0_10_47_10]
MKLAYIANLTIPSQKASGYQITKMCEQFAMHGADVTVYLPTRKQEVDATIFDYYGLKKDSFHVERIKSYDFLRWHPKIGKISFHLQTMWFLLQLFFFKLDKDTLVYTRQPEVAWVFGLRGFKTAFEVHRVFATKQWAFQLFTKRVTHVIAVTEGLKQQYKKMHPSRDILIQPDAVDMDIFASDISIEQARQQAGLGMLLGSYVVGYFGRFSTMGMQKGIDSILESLVSVPTAHFLCVGGTDTDIAHYTRKADALGVKKRVHFKGFVTRREVALYQKACNALLMPFPYTEHFAYCMSPLKMFEYMASKRPIIASDLPSVREILADQKNALLVKPGDSKSLAHAIRDIQNNTSVSTRLCLQAFEDVQRYTWYARADHILTRMREQKAHLLYATSITFPLSTGSGAQIAAMSRAFGKQHDCEFVLGVKKLRSGGEEFDIQECNAPNSLLRAFQYIQYAREQHITHVYCREPRLLLLVSVLILLFRLRIKTVYEIHEMPRNGIDQVVERFLSRTVDTIIFVTQHLEKTYADTYARKKQTHVFPDAVDPAIFDIPTTKEQARDAFGLPQEKFIIGYMGRFKTLEMDKGIADILSALKQLDSNVMFLAVGGKKRHREEYQQMAEEIGVGDRVLLVEHFAQPVIARYQKACDVLLMPFPWTEHFAYFMSPLKMFEYMASNRPILASDLPSVREVLSEERAFFCQPGDPNSIARAVNGLRHSRESANAAAQRAYRLVMDTYTWERRVKRILDTI